MSVLRIIIADLLNFNDPISIPQSPPDRKDKGKEPIRPGTYSREGMLSLLFELFIELSRMSYCRMRTKNELKF